MTTIFATGDLVLERENCSDLFAPSAPLLAEADIVIGQLEVPHTNTTEVMSTDVPATPAPPAALDDVVAAGFDVVTLAGNHVFDLGAQGIADTREHCIARGLTPVGAGSNLEDAWQPATIRTGDREVKILSVNCVGPRESWAGSSKPGCAYVEVLTHYEPRGANPGGPPSTYTFANAASLREFQQRIATHAAADTDLIVCLHKGLVHQPSTIAEYEFEIAHAAIDAGATAVVSHHAHLCKGVEVYRGRPIFHGLGNFVTVTRALSGGAKNSPEQQVWARERQRLFGFVPDPDMPDYPFHPESRNTAVAALHISEDGALTAELIPCWINDSAAPVPQDREEGGQAVGDYIIHITREAGLNTKLAWHGNRLSVLLEEESR